MKITYLKLENVAGLLVGSNKKQIEIDFSKSYNKIISVQAKNGSGKSCLLSALTPFSSVSTTIDERGSLSFIKEGKDGYKEIHFQNNSDIYVIKHFYKAQKSGGHSVKSYFSKNNEELNKNGNVSSFNDLVELHFGLTPEMVRLLRLGSNVNSFISLQPSRRKEYIGKLITEIETYLRIYKKISEDIRVLKVLISTNSNNIAKCNISDLSEEEKIIKKLKGKLTESEKEKEKLFAQISKLNEDKKEFVFNKIQEQLTESEQICFNFSQLENKIKSIKSKDELTKDKNKLSDEIIELITKTNSDRIKLDLNFNRVNELRNLVSKFQNFETPENLQNAINKLKLKLQNFIPLKTEVSSVELNSAINSLNSLNNIGKIILTFDNKVIAKFVQLKKKKSSVQNFIKEQSKQNLLMSRVNITELLKTLFKNDLVLVPNCNDEFKVCPFYRLSSVIQESSNSDELFSPDSLKQLEVLSQNFDLINEELKKIKCLKISSKLKEQFETNSVLEKLLLKTQLFETESLSEFLFQVRLSETYENEVLKLKDLEQKLLLYKETGVDKFITQIKVIESENQDLQKEITKLNIEINQKKNLLSRVENDLNLFSVYANQSQFVKQVKERLPELRQKFEKVKTIESELSSLQLMYGSKTLEVENLRESIKINENRVTDYIKLIDESEKLTKQYNELSLIHDSVSTKKGIPVLYIKSYLDKIYKFTNQLLEIIYDGELQIAEFNITYDSFEIPYIKNGTKVPDIKYGSQSEIALISMALSFALSKLASSKYNILLLDEIDSGLDDFNRTLFLQMLKTQMEQINAEQVFIISHNLANGMISVPMDVIKLSETNFNSKLFNIIYE